MIASQIVRSGFTVLFATKGQKGKRFGVNFPLGMKLSGPPFQETGDREPDMAAMKARMELSLQTLALIGPGENDTFPMSTMMAESLGVIVRIKPSQERCVYELKVPLNQDSLFKYAIGVGKDTLLKVTLETCKISRPSGGPPGGGMGGPPGGGMGGGRGGMGGPPGGGGMGGPPGGGMGGGRGGMGGPPGGGGPPSMPEQFKINFSILLAKK
jgi:hypothetical protein